jgi:hypothetical protein
MAEAKTVCDLLKRDYDKFNQDCAAVTAFRLVKALKTDEEKLQALYICANASALRQAISSAKQSKSGSIGDDLLGLVK